MSDYSPEYQKQILDTWFKHTESGLPPTARQVEVLKDATKSITKTEKLAKTIVEDSVKQLGRGLQGWTKAMYDGQQGMEAMAGQIDALGAVLTILTRLVAPQLAILTIGVWAATKVFGSYAKKSGQQADQLFKSYQDLNKNGMATPGGMADVYNNMQRFNYGLKDLAQMTAMLQENSTALATFGGTASEGMRSFADVTNQIQHSDIGKTFQKMGKTPDDINRGVAGFIKNQQDLGVSKTRILDRLVDRSAEYIKEIDLLNKLTGQDENQIQEKIAQAMAEDAFNQVQYELERRANAGDLIAKEQLKRNRDLAAILPGKIREEFVRGIGQDVASLAMTIATAPAAAALLRSQNFTVAEYLDAIGNGIKESRDRYGYQMKLNATEGFLYPAKDMSEMARYTHEAAQSQIDRTKAEQAQQNNALDPSTQSMVELRLAEQGLRDSFQNFINKGITPAVAAMEAVGKVAGGAVDLIPGTKSEVITDKPVTVGPAAGKPATGDLGAKGGVARTTAELRKMGLNLRAGDVQADGRLLDDRLINLAKSAQSQISGFHVITSLNDNFHAERYSTSQHAFGRAMDFTLDHKPTVAEGQQITQQLKGMGASYVIDEYNHPSKGATGGHFHAQVSAAMGFDGTLSGPASGYKPNIVMHGEERLTITPQSQAPTPAFSFDTNADTALLMATRLDKINQIVELFNKKKNNTRSAEKLTQLSEIVNIMQNQVSVSTKILQQSR
jgi:hypothetical protein